MVVGSDNKDLFWIAEVTNTNDKKVALHYYHYTINFLPKIEEFAKPASKKYKKNTICILRRPFKLKCIYFKVHICTLNAHYMYIKCYLTR
jgi:hypothetical protein